MKMSVEPTIDTTQTYHEESTPGSSTHTGSLSVTCHFDTNHKELTKHLKNHHVQQSVLDGYLLSGFQMVQKKDRELRQIAHVLKLLLEFGAKWKDGVLLEDQMTPHHLICQSNCDNAELLDLIITCFDGTLINSESHDGSTALLYAVENANLKCAKSLIAHGANVDVEDYGYANYSRFSLSQLTLSPIVETIRRLKPNSRYSSIVMTDILDLLLDSGVDVNKLGWPLKPQPIEYAIRQNNVPCVKKLIEKGARLDLTNYKDGHIWSDIARMGSVELLKCMLDHGIHVNCPDIEGYTLLSHIVRKCDVETIRSLLNLGVIPETDEISCMHCGKNRLLIGTIAEDLGIIKEPHIVACYLNTLDVVKLLEEYGDQSFKSMNALRTAVRHGSLNVAWYLLFKYKYPLNVEYALKCDDNIDYQNILIEACRHSTDEMIKLLLRYDADPNKNICDKKCCTALTTAIAKQHVEVVAEFIQSGVDINCRSYDQRYGNILPFEASVLYNNIHAAEMLLISGCSCGVFSLSDHHKFKVNVGPELVKLMKKWNVHDNNVLSLQIQCRRMILEHLSPKAVDKIEDCSLPLIIVQFLSIYELDDIVKAYMDANW